MWGALSFAVTVGVGAFAYSLGSGDITQGPNITPQMELFTVERAIVGGDVPIVDLSPGPDPSYRPKWAPSPASTVPRP